MASKQSLPITKVLDELKANVDEFYPPLQGEEASAACRDLIHTVNYKKVSRGLVDKTIPGQEWACITYHLPEAGHKLKSGYMMYGFVQLRGNYSTPEAARAAAAEIVRTQDSKHLIDVIPVGSLQPITADPSLRRNITNVNPDEDTEVTAAKEKIRKETEEKREKVERELKEREEEVKNGRDYNDDPDHIDYYTMKMVVWLNLLEKVEKARETLLKYETGLEKTRQILRELDLKHPDHIENWVDNYNIERRKAGVPDFVSTEKLENLYKETKDTCPLPGSSSSSSSSTSSSS